MSDVCVQEASYHFLILCVVHPGLLLEKVDRTLAQSNSDFDLFLIVGQLARRWKEIVNDFDIAQRLTGVSCFCHATILSAIQNNGNRSIHNIIWLIKHSEVLGSCAAGCDYYNRKREGYLIEVTTSGLVATTGELPSR